MRWSSRQKTIEENRLSALPIEMGTTAYDVERPPLSPAITTVEDPLVGRRIDHYEVRGLLGEGGMGSVYLAHDLSLERPVAIKVLRRELATNQHLVSRLVIEARAQARLQHPNVVTIYYIGRHEEAPYFAMEYVRGRTLADELAARGPLPWAEALEYVIQTTRALMAAHQRGIVHRDIKPSNLMLNGEPAPGAALPEVKVADFGLAAPPGTQEEHFVGSPFYASPEQIGGGAPNHRSDMYALGVTLHELLTGRLPFEADNLQTIAGLHRNAPRPHIPAERAPWKLRHLILEMMDPDPQKRPCTYEELLGRLEALRPRPTIVGGVVARGMALAVDLMILAIMAQTAGSIFGLGRHPSSQIGFLLFGIYYIVAHRTWGRTLGKRLLGLRIQGTTRAVSVLGIASRFMVEFWGPIVAVVMINLQLGAATNLDVVRDQVVRMVGVQAIPVLDQSTEALLRTVLVPNLIVAIPWLGGFLFALFDYERRAIHDHVARTRVIYAIRADEHAKS